MPQGPQGTGRHPHGKTDPSKSRPRSGETPRSASPNDGLKAREYRDADGQIHHHTKTYMDQHGKDGDRDR